MANMKVSIWFGREPRADFSVIFVGFQIFNDACPDEIQRRRCFIYFFHMCKAQNFNIESADGSEGLGTEREGSRGSDQSSILNSPISNPGTSADQGVPGL